MSHPSIELVDFQSKGVRIDSDNQWVILEVVDFQSRGVKVLNGNRFGVVFLGRKVMHIHKLLDVDKPVPFSHMRGIVERCDISWDMSAVPDVHFDVSLP